MSFEPLPPLVPGVAHDRCRAIAILPARNEEGSLAASLRALAAQRDTTGLRLAVESYEILLLLNNCNDASAIVARKWKEENPYVRFHFRQVTLPTDKAHVGTARRMLMDTAWHRLSGQSRICALLSTDADTLVAPDWIAQNLKALDSGADAVGGAIHLADGELEKLPPGARRAYLRDRRYQELVARLEDELDPQPGDPWPRHLHHFGASLACTPAMYERAEGLPPVTPLEDVAFVDALRRKEACLRHEPDVVVYTSSRLDGRAGIGLSHQFRVWQEQSDTGEQHSVPSAAWLTHRFRTLKILRDLRHETTGGIQQVQIPHGWRARILEARREAKTIGEFLAAIDSDRLIEATFTGAKESDIKTANRQLAREITKLKKAVRGTSQSAHIVEKHPNGGKRHWSQKIGKSL